MKRLHKIIVAIAIASTCIFTFSSCDKDETVTMDYINGTYKGDVKISNPMPYEGKLAVTLKTIDERTVNVKIEGLPASIGFSPSLDLSAAIAGDGNVKIWGQTKFTVPNMPEAGEAAGIELNPRIDAVVAGKKLILNVQFNILIITVSVDFKGEKVNE